jgi:hypothetical protein
LLKAVTTKSLAWSHEHEVRAIRVGSGEFSYPVDALTGIGFGLEASDSNKSMVHNWVAQAQLNVDFFQMRDNPTNLGLHRSS